MIGLTLAALMIFAAYKMHTTYGRRRSVHRPSTRGSGSKIVDGRVMYAFTKNPFRLTRTLVFMLWMQLGVTIISLMSDFGQLSLATSGDITVEAVEANDARQRLIGLLYACVFVVTSVIFLMWTYRANLNCHGFGPKGMRYPPGESIGWHFVPILNVILPYQAMKEIWKVSSDPMNWQVQQGSALLRWWWALWLASPVLSLRASSMAREAYSPSSLATATKASIVSSIAWMLLIIVAVMMISCIIEKQIRLTEGSTPLSKN